jgi:uncharacterized membrane protein
MTKRLWRVISWTLFAIGIAFVIMSCVALLEGLESGSFPWSKIIYHLLSALASFAVAIFLRRNGADD